MRDPLEELKIRVDNLYHLVADTRAALKDIGPQIHDGMSVYNERLDTMEFQFKELEKWHKRMWAVTSAETKMRFLTNTSGYSTKPEARLKTLEEAKLTQDDVSEFATTFDDKTPLGKRERVIALDYWVNLKPVAEMAKQHELHGNYIQQRAHHALRKIKHRKIAKRVLGPDYAPQ